MSKRVYIQRDGHNNGFWAIFLMAFIVIYAHQLILAAVVMFVTFMVVEYLARHQAVKKEQVDDCDEIVRMRADLQNRLAQAGDPAGVYGEYDAYTMPVTRPYVDFDDGLRGWK